MTWREKPEKRETPVALINISDYVRFTDTVKYIFCHISLFVTSNIVDSPTSRVNLFHHCSLPDFTVFSVVVPMDTYSLVYYFVSDVSALYLFPVHDRLSGDVSLWFLPPYPESNAVIYELIVFFGFSSISPFRQSPKTFCSLQRQKVHFVYNLAMFTFHIHTLLLVEGRRGTV